MLAGASPLDGHAQPGSPLVVGEQWQASIARERQLVAVARVVMMFDSFSMERVSGRNSGTVYPSAALLDKPAVAPAATSAIVGGEAELLVG